MATFSINDSTNAGFCIPDAVAYALRKEKEQEEQRHQEQKMRQFHEQRQKKEQDPRRFRQQVSAEPPPLHADAAPLPVQVAALRLERQDSPRAAVLALEVELSAQRDQHRAEVRQLHEGRHKQWRELVDTAQELAAARQELRQQDAKIRLLQEELDKNRQVCELKAEPPDEPSGSDDDRDADELQPDLGRSVVAAPRKDVECPTCQTSSSWFNTQKSDGVQCGRCLKFLPRHDDYLYCVPCDQILCFPCGGAVYAVLVANVCAKCNGIRQQATLGVGRSQTCKACDDEIIEQEKVFTCHCGDMCIDCVSCEYTGESEDEL